MIYFYMRGTVQAERFKDKVREAETVLDISHIAYEKSADKEDNREVSWML